MRTTFGELAKLFKLNDADNRQLKIALVNKISFTNENNVKVKDAELDSLINNLREGEVLDRFDACKLYGISSGSLSRLINEGVVSHFQLTASKGSKILFFRKDLERERKVNLKYLKGRDINEVLRRQSEVFAPLRGTHFTERVFDIAEHYFYQRMSMEEIGEKFGLTRARVGQLLSKFEGKLGRVIKSHFDYKIENENFKVKCKILEEEIRLLREKVKEEQAMPLGLNEILCKGIREIDFSVRAMNCLKHADIETIHDLVKHTRMDLLKMRNFGKGSLSEIDGVLLKEGISFSGAEKKWLYFNEPINI